MHDFQQKREIAYSALCLVEKVSKTPVLERGNKKFIETWCVETEVMSPSGLLEIELNVCIPACFPETYPRVYIEGKTFDIFRHLPHIESNGYVCVLRDEVEFDEDYESSDIIIYFVNRAKSIIESGLRGSNHEDYMDEMLSYWSRNVSSEKCYGWLGWLPAGLKHCQYLDVYHLDTPIDSSSIIISSPGFLEEQLKDFLERCNIQVVDQSNALFIGLLNYELSPPYLLHNIDVSNIINSYDECIRNELIKYINSQKFPTIIFKTIIDGQDYYLGWRHDIHFDNKRNGFRPSYWTPYKLLSSYQKNDEVSRVTFKIVNKDRLTQRTTGHTIYSEFSFIIVGLGSIGSHLIPYLNSMDAPNLTLIDDDRLVSDNIKRHLLGLSYTGKPKVDALKDYCVQNDPIQNVLAINDDILSAIYSCKIDIHGADYLFMCTGNHRVEKYVDNLRKTGIIHKPIFFIWVEPYLAAGHCLFVPADSSVGYDDFFDNSLYRYNMISEQEYQNYNPLLSLKEAGCQSVFTPYSGKDVLMFLGAIFPYIDTIITDSTCEVKHVTWVGNISLIESKNIKLSSIAIGKHKGEVIE